MTSTYTMDDATLRILKNFSGLSQSVMLRPGTEQKGVDGEFKSMMAIADFPTEWPAQTGIFDLSTLLGVLSTFPGGHNAKISFTGGEEGNETVTEMIISSGKYSFRFRCADPSTIPTIPEKTLDVSDPKLIIPLTQELMTALRKACAMMNIKDTVITISARSDGNFASAEIVARNEKDTASHIFSATVDLTPEAGVVYDMSQSYRAKHFNLLMDGDYNLWFKPESWRYGYFIHASEPIRYYIVAQR